MTRPQVNPAQSLPALVLSERPEDTHVEELMHAVFRRPPEGIRGSARAAPILASATIAIHDEGARSVPSSNSVRRTASKLRWLIPLAVISVSVGAFLSWQHLRPSNHEMGVLPAARGTVPFAVKVGELLPAFRGYRAARDQPGQVFGRDDLIGYTAILYVWSSSDASAAADLARLDRFAQSVTASQPHVRFVSLNLDRTPSTALAFLEAINDQPWIHLFDQDDRLSPGERVSSLLGTFESPALYLVDGRSRLKASGFGPTDLSRVLGISE